MSFVGSMLEAGLQEVTLFDSRDAGWTDPT